MTPTSEALPELKRWRPRDAALTWKFTPEKGFVVSGFNRKLAVAPWKPSEDDALAAGGHKTGWRSPFGGGFLAMFTGGGDKRPRCPPSGGNPSVLAGKRVDTEEDVLHLAKLPTFDGLLKTSESELLLTYLTAPYVRIPLAMRLFADPTRVRALCHRDIQSVLDAVLFEPGPWAPPGRAAVPPEIPAPTRAHMATPAGLLFHELSVAPAPLVDAAEEILALSLEMDTGAFYFRCKRERCTRGSVCRRIHFSHACARACAMDAQAVTMRRVRRGFCTPRDCWFACTPSSRICCGRRTRRRRAMRAPARLSGEEAPAELERAACGVRTKYARIGALFILMYTTKKPSKPPPSHVAHVL